MVRKDVGNYMIKHSTQFFCNPHCASKSTGFCRNKAKMLAYLQMLRDEQNKGDGKIMQAAANLYKVNIELYTNKDKPHYTYYANNLL